MQPRRGVTGSDLGSAPRLGTLSGTECDQTDGLMAAVHRTRAWRNLRDQVVAEEPLCQLRLSVCTGLSETADHIVTVHDRPDLAMERANLRGSCHACNRKRNKYPIAAPREAKALNFFQ